MNTHPCKHCGKIIPIPFEFCSTKCREVHTYRPSQDVYCTHFGKRMNSYHKMKITETIILHKRKADVYACRRCGAEVVIKR